MRVTTEVWVGALLRRMFGEGDYGLVERRGASEAGAVFLRVLHRDGTGSLLGPAPQVAFDTEKPRDRCFEMRLSGVSADEIDALLERERRFDPDLWIVELETDDPSTYVEIMPV